MLPELLTRINAERAALYVLDDRFWLQQKHDGVRLTVHRQGQQIEGWNKQAGVRQALDNERRQEVRSPAGGAAVG